jgi:hypothetical protein
MIDGGTNPITSTQLDIQLASGIIADYVVIGEDPFFTSSATNAFSPSFEYTLQSNVDGLHTVYLQLLNTNGAASSPLAATVQVEQGPPVIWISSPTNGAITGQRRIDVQGFAGDANTNASAPLQVTVNGNFANGRDTNGNWWSAQYPSPGTNTFVAIATGLAGLTATSAVSFVYDPTLATNVPNFTLDVTNTVTVGSNTTAIAVSGSIDDSNATVQIIVLNASDNTITNAVVNAAVLGTNWWGNVPVVAGNNAVIVSAQNSNSQPATNGFVTVQNTNVFLVIDSPAADTGVNDTSVLVVGHASTNFNKTITINGVPALTSTDGEGIIFSNSVPINNTDANIVGVDATGSDGSSATTRETCYGYELQAFHLHYHGWFLWPDLPVGIEDATVDWDASGGNTYHTHQVLTFWWAGISETGDFDTPCNLVCGSANSGDVCLDFYTQYGPGWWMQGAAEGYSSYNADGTPEVGSWDSQLTAIKHAPVTEEQLVVFHFTSLAYVTYWVNGMNFDPSQITFQGAPGFWYIQDGQTNGVAFLIKIMTNTPFTIQPSDFQFPPMADPCDYPECGGTSHTLQFTGFGNALLTLTMYVDQPVPGTRNPWAFGTGNVGHAWWAFAVSPTNETANVVPTSLLPFVNKPAGYYPNCDNLLPCFNPTCPGMLVIPDTGSSANVSKSFSLGLPQFLSGLSYTKALNDSPGTYNLNTKNCADAALGAAAAAGTNIQSQAGSWFPCGGGHDPGDLGQDLRNLN